jgi:hypothetical protein
MIHTSVKCEEVSVRRTIDIPYNEREECMLEKN